MDYKNVTLAIATDDGTTISAHFGRAQFYEILIFKAGVVAHRERREKPHHASFQQSENKDADHSAEGHHHRHHAMTVSLPDCQAVVARGMGEGAFEHLRVAGLNPVLTGLHTIEEAILAVKADALEHDPHRIHQHHGQH